MSDPAAQTGTVTPEAGEPQTTDSQAAVQAGQEASAVKSGESGSTEQEAKGDEPQVPESYEFAMPDGIELDKDAATEFSAIAKELKLDQATAQKVADVAANMAQRQAKAHADLVASWTEQVKSDPEIGGDKLEQNTATARKAVDAFGGQELKDVLNMTGLGNHPAVVKAFLKIGKAISEDGFVRGAAQAPNSDPAKKMFPTMQ